MADQRVFRVMLRMVIHPGMEAKFEETWHQVGHTITADPANIRQWLSRDAEDQSVYYVVSDWVDERGFRKFERSEQHLEHRTKLHPFRASATMASMHVVFEMIGAAYAAQPPAVSILS